MNFVERFLVVPTIEEPVQATYDESKGYALTVDGKPAVAEDYVAGTQTVTRVRNESPDSDPAPSVETLTFVEAEGADYADQTWVRMATETVTTIRAEERDYGV
jgi:hypothetical protein